MESTMITLEQIKLLFNLKPLQAEGGYFAETYRSHHLIPEDALPKGYEGKRALSTAIYYLLTPDTFSALHRLPTDEIYHFYLGDPVEMLQLFPDGTGKVINYPWIRYRQRDAATGYCNERNLAGLSAFAWWEMCTSGYHHVARI
jgi:predicted cupin superfamily sugar epimerase